MELDEETVDINTASVEEFVSRLKGVGRSKAKAIVRFRTTVGKFKKLCELTDVPGITQCILERNQGILLCVSSSDLSTLSLSTHRVSNNDECSLEEGELSESSLISSGESEGGCYTESLGQHPVREQITNWSANKDRCLSPICPEISDIDGNNDGFLALETPSTSINHLDNCSEHSELNNDTPTMYSSRTRSRVKSEERTFNMSTRSRPATEDKPDKTKIQSEYARARVGTLTITPQASCSISTRGKSARAKKSPSFEDLKPDRMITRRRVDSRTSESSSQGEPNKDTNGNNNMPKIETENPNDSEMEVEKEDRLKADTIGLSNGKQLHGASTKLLMKRKLDSRLDIGKFQSPEKKACKSSLSFIPVPNAPLPTFGELKATTRGVGLYRPLNENHNDVEVDSWKRTISPGSPRRFSSDILSLAGGNAPRCSVKVEGLPEWLGKFQKWNQAERITALDNLIDACEPRQVRHMLQVIEPQFQRDFISLLPKELGLYVLSFLEPKDLLTAAQTCRYWHILTEDNLLWREKCAEESISEPYYPRVNKNSWKCKKINSINGSTTQPSTWKTTFLHHHKIEMNWRNGDHKSAGLLKGHDDHVITCLQFNGSKIVSGSDDNTLKVWSAISGKCLRTLTGHTGGVWASQMRKNMIISGSTDRTLKIWNADTGQCLHTLYGHTSTVRCMALHDNIVVSGSRDATLRAWDIDTGECLHVLTGHMAAVRCVCYDGKLVVSGAYDYMVKVWDPKKEECLHTLQGHTNRVYSLQFDGVHVVSGSLDTSIRVWSVETGICLHTLVGHQSLTSGMELKNNILVSGNADSTVKMWDIVTGDCLKTLEGPNKHQSAVTCLQFYGKFVITSSDDGTVKLWDVKTGKAIRDLVSLESRGSGGVVWRIRASQTKLVCAVGSRNGTEETKLLVLDFDPDSKS